MKEEPYGPKSTIEISLQDITLRQIQNQLERELIKSERLKEIIANKILVAWKDKLNKELILEALVKVLEKYSLRDLGDVKKMLGLTT